ncbi:hypothetical protein HBI78_201890 [Parastagonospora nodorum]|nr:hypothetical protein HBI78_201890 [Parastagonospora nodorum]
MRAHPLSSLDLQSHMRNYGRYITIFPFPYPHRADAVYRALCTRLTATLKKFPFSSGMLDVHEGELRLLYDSEATEEERVDERSIVWMHHCVADGTGLTRFYKAWSSNTRELTGSMDAKAQDREGGNVAYALDELAKSSPPETMTRTFTHEYKHTEKRGFTKEHIAARLAMLRADPGVIDNQDLRFGSGGRDLYTTDVRRQGAGLDWGILGKASAIRRIGWKGEGGGW